MRFTADMLSEEPDPLANRVSRSLKEKGDDEPEELAFFGNIGAKKIRNIWSSSLRFGSRQIVWHANKLWNSAVFICFFGREFLNWKITCESCSRCRRTLQIQRIRNRPQSRYRNTGTPSSKEREKRMLPICQKTIFIYTECLSYF